MKKLLILSDRPSDLSRVLATGFETRPVPPAQACAADFDAADAVCVLGGTQSAPLILPVDARILLEAFRETEKPVFVEYCGSFADTYTRPPVSDTADRLIWAGPESDALRRGDLLDDHDNTLSAPYFAPEGAEVLLYCGGHVMKHDRAEEVSDTPPVETWALWRYDAHTLACSFRLCDFLRARMAPAARWAEVVRHIAAFLGGEVEVPAPPVRLRGSVRPLREVFADGMRWLDGMLLDEGLSGTLEGLSHNIRPDGEQLTASAVRNDCAGEIAGAFFFDWLLNGNEQSLARFRNLTVFTLDKMVIHTGWLRGMMRWTTVAWGVCYQDDAARCLLGQLLYMKLTGDKTRLPDVEAVLDFLVRTTGTDGLRQSRTDNIRLTPEKLAALAAAPSDFPCAHHNAYYLAVLLLAYQLDRDPRWLDTARRGLASLMAVFPDTIREHSETQELARLILPLAVLYETVGEGKDWLYAVADRLERYRHPSGAYCEYDTGYKAKRSRTSGTESSLLADNGDEVADLLYTSNWLPLGFAYAWHATGDPVFRERWQRIADFMAAAQIESDSEKTRGAWPRGVDLARMEIYGVPHDVGWGPACIESGWTVAEILMGIGFGQACAWRQYAHRDCAESDTEARAEATGRQ